MNLRLSQTQSGNSVFIRRGVDDRRLTSCRDFLDIAIVFLLQAQEENAYATQEDGGAGDGMHVSFEFPEPDHLQAKGSEQYQGQHGQHGDHAEYDRNLYDAPCAAMGGGVHKKRYQGFTGTQKKNGEQYPGCDIGPVNMVMCFLVCVLMYMFCSVMMIMDMLVGLVYYSPVNPP